MKRTNLYALTLTSAAMVCGAAAAQEKSTTTPPSATRSGALDHNLSAGNVHASNVIGASVKNKAGDTIGSIDDLIVSSTANVTTAIMTVGGVLGVGGKKVGLPYKDFSTSPDGKTLYLNMTEEQLKALPAFDETDQHAAASRTHVEHDTAAPAVSQSRTAAPPRDETASTTHTANASSRVLKASEQPASALIGAEVVDRADSRIGKIKDLIVSAGRGAQAVLAVGGGIANIGGKMVAVPLDDLTIKRDADNPKHEPDRVQSTLTVAQIDALPEFRYE